MTVEEAKKIYMTYECSLFSMAREEKILYDEFNAINLSESTLEQWKQELFISLLEALKENGSSRLFNRLYHLAENMKSNDNFFALKEALDYIKYDNFETKICIAETILGRKDLSVRSGMIFQAYDLGEYEIVRELLNLVGSLLDFQTDDKYLESRCDRVAKKHNLICCELKL